MELHGERTKSRSRVKGSPDENNRIQSVWRKTRARAQAVQINIWTWLDHDKKREEKYLDKLPWHTSPESPSTPVTLRVRVIKKFEVDANYASHFVYRD